MSKGIRADVEERLKQDNKNRILSYVGVKKRATFKELLEALDISRPALTKYIKELELEGQLAWQRNPEDRRSGYYMLTEKAKKSDYFRQKALALHYYLPIYRIIKNRDRILKEVLDEGRSQEEAESVFRYTFAVQFAESFLNILAYSLKYPIPHLAETFLRLVSIELVGSIDDLDKRVDLMHKELQKTVPNSADYINKLLNEIEEPEFREMLKEQLFS